MAPETLIPPAGEAQLLGLSLLPGRARRTSRRGRDARRGLSQSRRQTAAVSQDRDDLIGQRDAARAYTERARQRYHAQFAQASDELVQVLPFPWMRMAAGRSPSRRP